MRKLLGLLLLAAGTALTAQAGDWTDFRGPGRTGRTSETGVPQQWGPSEHVRWRTPLPGPGNSSPVVAGDTVFVTCATERGKQRGTYAFDRQSGKQRWQQVVSFLEEDPTHGTNPYCGSSPAVAAGRVVVWHGSAGVHCYSTTDGQVLWSRDLGLFRHIWGYGSSPVIDGKLVYLNCGPGARQFVIAIELESGKTVWQQDVPGGDAGEENRGDGDKPLWTGSWSTPVVATIEGRRQVLVSLPRFVQAYDAASGEPTWRVDGLGDLVYTDIVLGDGVAVAMGGYHGPAIGFKLGGTGNTTETNRLWQQTSRNPQRIGSGVIVDGLLYIANEIGLAQCLDPKTGTERWKARLPGSKLWGSTIFADGRLYTTNQEGTTIVWTPNAERLEVLAENRLGEHSNSTPAFSNGQIFLRTYENLYCVEN